MPIVFVLTRSLSAVAAGMRSSFPVIESAQRGGTVALRLTRAGLCITRSCFTWSSWRWLENIQSEAQQRDGASQRVQDEAPAQSARISSCEKTLLGMRSSQILKGNTVWGPLIAMSELVACTLK